jgi:hypothetical protein
VRGSTDGDCQCAAPEKGRSCKRSRFQRHDFQRIVPPSAARSGIGEVVNVSRRAARALHLCSRARPRQRTIQPRPLLRAGGRRVMQPRRGDRFGPIHFRPPLAPPTGGPAAATGRRNAPAADHRAPGSRSGLPLRSRSCHWPGPRALQRAGACPVCRPRVRRTAERFPVSAPRSACSRSVNHRSPGSAFVAALSR